MNFLIRKCLYMTLCLAFCISAGQVHGQVIYRITGFANNIGDGIGGAPEVGPGEAFVAEFEIDLSVEDSDPDPDNGVYTGAILSSSIEFEGGYVSQVDFAGGEITVQRDNAGGGVFFNDVNELGSILIFDLNNSFASDALLMDPTTEFTGSPESLYVLFEPTGFISSFSDVAFGDNDGVPTGPVAFSIVIVEVEPPLLGDLNQNGAVNFLDIAPFILRLTTGEFQVEADIDQSGEVNFMDISPFIEILTSASASASGTTGS